MGANSDSDDYVLVGTPIEQAAARHKAAAAAGGPAAVSRAPPVWQQAATDEQGRRRFHGAFTGGFSAGYYNTVGSKEGWTPSSFVSSRSARVGADAKPDARAFMDEDEQLELDARRNAVGTRAEFDTAKAAAEAQSTAEGHRAVLDGARPAAVPGPVPSELVVVPVTESIGTRLLRAMGWRPGGAQLRRSRGVADGPAAAARAAPRVQAALSALLAGEEAVLAGDEAEAHDAVLFGVPVTDDSHPDQADEGDDAAAAAADRMRRRRRRWGALAGALADDADVEFPVAKLDTHGLGYDPFSGAEEFRAIKRRRQDEAGHGGRGGGRAGHTALRERGTAFGVGVFEAADDDIYGDGEPQGRRMLMSLPTVADDDASDEDQAPGRRAAVLPALGAAPERLALKAPPPRDRGAFGLDGFVRASATEAPQKHYPPPVVPRDFKPVHVFAQPYVDAAAHARGASTPGKPAVPADGELVRRCDTLAAFVARNGPGFEALARQRQAKDPRFSFLFNGPGSEYYAWKRATLCNEAAPAPRPEQRSRPLTAVERGQLLGEEPLAGQPGASAAPAVIPSRDAAAQARARGIADSDRAALLSSMGRTFVKEDSAAAPPAPPLQYGLQLSANRFATGGIEMGGQPVAGAARPTGGQSASGVATSAADLPPVQRSVDDWGPEPLLCKRFGVPDPYKGRQRPVERRTFRTDTLALPATAQAEAEAAPKFLLGAAPASEQQAPAPPAAGAPPAVAKDRGTTVQQETAATAADEADDFFASLAPPTGAGDAAAVPDASVAPPVASVPTIADRPMDLFKAIFEASDDDDNDDAGDVEEDTAPPEGGRMPTAQQQMQQQVPAAQAQHAAAAHPTAQPPQQPPLPPAPLSALAAFAKELKAAKHKSKEKKRKKHKSRDKGKQDKGKHKKKHKRRSRSRSGDSSDTDSSGE